MTLDVLKKERRKLQLGGNQQRPPLVDTKNQKRGIGLRIQRKGGTSAPKGTKKKWWNRRQDTLGCDKEKGVGGAPAPAREIPRFGILKRARKKTGAWSSKESRKSRGEKDRGAALVIVDRSRTQLETGGTRH